MQRAHLQLVAVLVVVLVLVLVVVLVLAAVLVVILILAVVLIAILVVVLVIHFYLPPVFGAVLPLGIDCPKNQDLSFALKIKLASSPAVIAAVIPPAVALMPPVSTPRKPFSSIASRTPFARL